MIHSSLMLYYTQGSSDKYYHISVVGEGNSWSVPFDYGRRGQTGPEGFKVQSVSLDDALRAYNRTVGEKTGKGYTDDPSGTPGTFSGNMNQVVPTSRSSRQPDRPATSQPVAATSASARPVPAGDGPAPWPVQVLDEAMEESNIQTMLHDDDWVAQQKHDGKRMILEWDGALPTGTLRAYNKKGIQCGFHPRYEQAVLNSASRFVLDGESVGEIFWAFDILHLDGTDLRGLPYSQRLSALERLQSVFAGVDAIRMVMTADNEQQKRNLLRILQDEGREGIVFKRKDARYQPGKNATQVKYKFKATCTCRVEAQNAKSSVRLVVLQAPGSANTVFIGNVTIPPNKLKPANGTLVEIEYLYIRRGGCLYQPVYLGARDESEANLDDLTKLKYKDEAQTDDDEAAAAPDAPATDLAYPVMGTVRLIRW